MLKKVEYILSIILLFLTILSLGLCSRSDKSLRLTPELQPIHIDGTFSINGSSHKQLSPGDNFPVSDYNTVCVRGHFSENIPENKQLLLRLSNVTAVLKVNGQIIYSNTEVAGRFFRSPGNGWTAVSSPGIRTTDEIEFILSNVYRNGNPKTFSHALNEMYLGYENDLARTIFRQSAGSILFGFLTIPLGLLLLLTGIVIRQLNSERIFSLALFCLSVGIWILTDPNYMAFLLDSPGLILALGQISQFLQLVSITKFVGTIVQNKLKIAVGGIHVATVLLFSSAIFFQLAGIKDYYDFTQSFMVLNAIVCISLLLALSAESLQNNNYAKKTLLSILPLGIFSLAEQIAWVNGHYYKGSFTQVGFVIFLAIQAVYTIKDAKILIYRLEMAQYAENKLIESRIAIILSQIQPHFLCNALTGIKQLCDTDPKKASDALEHFTYFLRRNLDSLTGKQLIPFAKELEHLQDYLFLEKIRFGDKLNFQTELHVTDFMLPPLTLQPIVENSVRYGIMKKKEGGTITIKSESIKNSVILTITDDGAGFDIGQFQDDGRSHVGISNVKKRLIIQCRGSLDIQSEPGIGTTVTIILPQEGELK